MRGRARILTLLGLALSLVACGGSGDDGDGETARLRSLLAVEDAPELDVAVNDLNRWRDVAFSEGTGFVEIEAGRVELGIDGQFPDQRRTLAGPLTTPIDAGRDYTLVALGPAREARIVLLEEPERDVSAGALRLRALHALPGVEQAQLFVTPPGAELAASAPLGPLEFGQASAPLELAPGDYQLRLTVGEPGRLLFDSGPVRLQARRDLLIGALPSAGFGASPVRLVALDTAGDTRVLWDVGTPAGLRLLHASRDAPAVDVVVDGDFATPLVQDLPYGRLTEYLELPPGASRLTLTAAGNPGAILLDTDPALAQGERRTVVVAGTLAALQALVLQDAPRGIAYTSRLRLVHAAPTTAPVDIYLTAPGRGLIGVEPVRRAVAFAESGGYLDVVPGQYELTVTDADSRNILIGPTPVDLQPRAVSTAAVLEPAEGGVPLRLVAFDAVP